MRHQMLLIVLITMVCSDLAYCNALSQYCKSKSEAQMLLPRPRNDSGGQGRPAQTRRDEEGQAHRVAPLHTTRSYRDQALLPASLLSNI